MLSEEKKMKSVKVHHNNHIKVNANGSAVEAVGSICLVVHALRTPNHFKIYQNNNRSSNFRHTVATKVMFICALSRLDPSRSTAATEISESGGYAYISKKVRQATAIGAKRGTSIRARCHYRRAVIFVCVYINNYNTYSCCCCSCCKRWPPTIKSKIPW